MTTTMNIEWIRGQTEEWVLTVFDPDGALANLDTLNDLQFRIKKSIGDADPPILSLSLSLPITTPGIVKRTQSGVNLGIADLTATSDQTFAIPAGQWHFDVLSLPPVGKRKFVIVGLLTVKDVVNFP